MPLLNWERAVLGQDLKDIGLLARRREEFMTKDVRQGFCCLGCYRSRYMYSQRGTVRMMVDEIEAIENPRWYVELMEKANR
jgi:hypothetical protein